MSILYNSLALMGYEKNLDKGIEKIPPRVAAGGNQQRCKQWECFILVNF